MTLPYTSKFYSNGAIFDSFGSLDKTYLSYYPEDKQRYWEMESWLRLLTDHIFNMYCGIYKERSVDFACIPKMYQTHLSSIHAKYLKDLRSAGSTVNKAVVRDYINNLPVPRLLFMLNYKNRMPLNV